MLFYTAWFSKAIPLCFILLDVVAYINGRFGTRDSEPFMPTALPVTVMKSTSQHVTMTQTHLSALTLVMLESLAQFQTLCWLQEQ